MDYEVIEIPEDVMAETNRQIAEADKRRARAKAKEKHFRPISLCESEMNSLDFLIDYLNEHASTIAEEVQECYGECGAIHPITDLCDIYNRSIA